MTASAYPANMPLCELATPEALLVTTVRLFLTATPGVEQDPVYWWEGLARATSGYHAAATFEQFLRVVLLASSRPLDLRCPCDDELGEDEGRLLQVIALHQHRRPDAAQAILAAWLPPAACRIAAAHAGDLARFLARHRLVVPWRCPQMDGFVRPLHGDPGLMLVQ